MVVGKKEADKKKQSEQLREDIGWQKERRRKKTETKQTSLGEKDENLGSVTLLVCF